MSDDLDAALGEVTAALRAATVRIEDPRGRGAGAGVVWPGGTIVTNAHVVGTRRVWVELPDGARFGATVVHRDPRRDLALVEVDDARALRRSTSEIVVRASQTLRVGELVVAVGYPLGMGGAVSAGIALRAGRLVVADVRLLPGNSGGPLADVRGRIVGVNAMVANGLALAIPTETVLRLIQSRDVRAA